MDGTIKSSQSLRIKNGILRPSNSQQKTRTSKSSISLKESKYYLSEQNLNPERENEEEETVVNKPPESFSACDCGPDFYTRVLGPTADETILTGLQTVMKLCNKLIPCGNNRELEDPQRDTFGDFEIPERDSSTSTPGGSSGGVGRGGQTDDKNLKASKSQTDPRKIVASPSQTDSNKIKSSKSQTKNAVMVSAGFQVKPSMKTREAQTSLYPEMVSKILQTLGFDPETASEIVQTSFTNFGDLKDGALVPKQVDLLSREAQTSYPDMVSKILQTLGFDPETASQIVQTSFTNFGDPNDFLLPPRQASASSMSVQTPKPSVHSQKSQTKPPDSVSGFIQTSNSLLATISSGEDNERFVSSNSIGTQSDSVAMATKATMVEKPGVLKRSSKTSPNASTTSASHTSINGVNGGNGVNGVNGVNGGNGVNGVNGGKGGKGGNGVNGDQATTADEHKCISPPEPPAHAKTCKCCKCTSSTKLSKESDKNGHTKPCSCNTKKRRSRQSNLSVHEDKESPLEVKYAITKISKFKEFSTFEVTRSTRKVPSHIPDKVESIFVLKRNKEKNKKEESGKKLVIETDKESVKSEKSLADE